MEIIAGNVRPRVNPTRTNTISLKYSTRRLFKISSSGSQDVKWHLLCLLLSSLQSFMKIVKDRSRPLNNAGFPEEPENSSLEVDGDIPPALRDSPEGTSKLRLTPLLIIGSFIGFVLLAAASGVWFFITERDTSPVATPNVTPSVDPKNSDRQNPQNQNPQNQNPQNKNTLLGHISYPEAPLSELAAISADGRIKMRKSAAKRFQEMAAAARSQGVILAPLSGFRSEKDQKPLFFSTAARRNQTPSQRAAVSAPPGYSEHHTGYAVDIGDGRVPATNLSTKFEDTGAYKWLEANAAKYGFELSFPLDNSQGVSYEPWHWRFVGDRDSLETFYKARNLKPTPPSP